MALVGAAGSDLSARQPFAMRTPPVSFEQKAEPYAAGAGI